MHVSIDQACQLLKNGHVVAVPTETVYGLAAALDQPKAIANIFTLKKRPANNPLIIHLGSADQILAFTDTLPPQFSALAAAFWPGPLTMVMAVSNDKVPTKVRGDLPTAAFRVPANPLTRQLLALSGALVMPSANLSGTPSATLAAHVEHDFGQNFPVIDGGECVSGIESTIIICQEGLWKIIRLGALAPEAFTPILGYQPAVVAHAKGDAPLCPGQLYRHYAPHARLVMATQFPADLPKAIVIGFADRHYPANYRLISLGASSAPEEAAHHLYAVLRQIDAEGLEMAYIDVDFPDHGLWRTLRERISKAAQP